MKKNLLWLIAALLPICILACKKEASQRDDLSTTNKYLPMMKSSNLNQGGFSKNHSRKENAFLFDSLARIASQNLHNGLLKKYWEHHKRIKAAPIDTTLTPPIELLLVEMTDSLATSYLNMMKNPAREYICTHVSSDTLNGLNDCEVVLLSTMVYSADIYEQQGFQIDTLFMASPEQIAAAPADSGLLSRIEGCMMKSCGVGAGITAVGEPGILTKSIPEIISWFKSAAFKTVGSWLTAISMSYTFGACMGWLWAPSWLF